MYVYVCAGLEVSYSCGVTVAKGMDVDDCTESYSVQLQPNERITKVDVRYGWMVDCLGFHTNLGKLWHLSVCTQIDKHTDIQTNT